MTSKLSFNNNPAEKNELDALILMHETADNFVQGQAWNADVGKGCSIGCINHNYSHQEIADKYNVPMFFVLNADTIFEGLSVADSKTFTREYWEHVPVGVDDSYFKALYHFICVKQIKEALGVITDVVLSDLLHGAVALHSAQATDFSKLHKKFSAPYAAAYAYAYAAYSNTAAYANAYANAYAYASAASNANASNANTYATSYANAANAAKVTTYKFTRDVTIAGLQMSKDDLKLAANDNGI